jgi:hypothetical protein
MRANLLDFKVHQTSESGLKAEHTIITLAYKKTIFYILMPKKKKAAGFHTEDHERVKPLTYYFKEYDKVEEQRNASNEIAREQGVPVFPAAPDPRGLPPAPARIYSEVILKAMRRDPDFSDKVKLLPEYEKYVEENYPPMSWISRGNRLYFKIRKEPSKILGHVPAIVAYSSNGEPFIAEPVSETTYLTRNEKLVKEAIKKFVKNIFGTQLEYPIRVRKEVHEEEEVYVFDELVPAQDLFIQHVYEGLIKDEKGRILSDTEVQGKLPEGGFLNQFDNMLLGASKDWRENIPYYPGLVIKICGDYRQDLREDHNTWAVITKVLDPYRYEVMQEGSRKKLILRDTDVKGIVGDYEHDFIGIGKDRHEKEVKPLIEQALRKYLKEQEDWRILYYGGQR